MYTQTFRNAVRQAAKTAGVTITQDWTNEIDSLAGFLGERRTVIFQVSNPTALAKTFRRSVGNVVADDKELNFRIAGSYLKADCALSR